MAGIAVILLLLIIFLGIEGAKNAIGGFFNFIIWSLAIMIGIYLISKLFEDRRSDAEKKVDEKEREKRAKLEAELREKRKKEEAIRNEWKQSYKRMWKFWLKAILIITASVSLLAAICIWRIK